VTAIAKTVQKYSQTGKRIDMVGLNEESRQLIERTGLAG